jgi:hypothetical protein
LRPCMHARGRRKARGACASPQHPAQCAPSHRWGVRAQRRRTDTPSAARRGAGAAALQSDAKPLLCNLTGACRSARVSDNWADKFAHKRCQRRLPPSKRARALSLERARRAPDVWADAAPRLRPPPAVDEPGRPHGGLRAAAAAAGSWPLGAAAVASPSAVSCCCRRWRLPGWLRWAEACARQRCGAAAAAAPGAPPPYAATV